MPEEGATSIVSNFEAVRQLLILPGPGGWRHLRRRRAIGGTRADRRPAIGRLKGKNYSFTVYIKGLWFLIAMLEHRDIREILNLPA